MSPNRRQHVAWLACMMGGIVLSTMLVLVGLSAHQASAEYGPAPAGLPPDQILSQPRPLFDQVVTIDAEVGRVWSRRVLALRSHLARQGLLVVLAGGVQVPLRPGQAVHIVGIVRPLNRAEVQALTINMALDPRHQPLLAIYANAPYILALEVCPASS